MKHIKRKFLVEKKKGEILKEGITYTSSEPNNPKIPKNISHDSHRVYIETDQDLMIGSYIHKTKGREMIIPQVDFVLIYFNNAQILLKQISESKDKLSELVKYEPEKLLTHDMTNILFAFFGQTTGFVIFLFTAIESMINKSIPMDYIFRVDKKKTLNYIPTIKYNVNYPLI